MVEIYELYIDHEYKSGSYGSNALELSVTHPCFSSSPPAFECLPLAQVYTFFWWRLQIRPHFMALSSIVIFAVKKKRNFSSF